MNLRLTISLLLPATFMLLLAGCGGDTSAPSVDIEATVEARVAEERAIEATVETKEQAIAKAAPTSTPVPPTPTPTATVTPTLVPTTAQRKGKVDEKETSTQPAAILGLDKIFGQFPCSEDGTIAFNSTFFPPSFITAIVPMGKVSPKAGHVTPTDHLYIHRYPPLGEDTDYVLAPADGFIVNIGRFSDDQSLIAGDQSAPKVPDHRVVFMHSCTFFTIFIHLGELAPVIAEKTGEIPFNGYWLAGTFEAIEVKSGQPIAKFGGDSLDWSVHDADTTLSGFVVPEHYEEEPWKIHTVDPLQFYEEPLKSDLLSKVVRKVEPRAGKIDYDIEGTIAGNWFLDGTVDYSGNLATGSPRYWEGHLSIVYGYIDPTQIRVSIGFDTGISSDLCNICFGAYGVRGNQPDPAAVNSESGLIKYELMSRHEQSKWVKEQVGSTSLGTFLVQHLGDRTIRIEVIPGKAPDEVSGFSDSARIYRR